MQSSFIGPDVQTFPSTSAKPPRVVFDTVFAFPPNRATLGGTAYLILEETGNILVDCPAWDDENREFLQQHGVRWLVLTHRGGIGAVAEMVAEMGCEVVIQEQEAYLLPGLTVKAFQTDVALSPTSQMIWTAGHSPGSACLYHSGYGGVLFTGRHLLPDGTGRLVPLRLAKTFHWRRQVEAVGRLRDRFSTETLAFACPGANIGFLRGQMRIDRAYERLAELDLAACLVAKPGL